MEAQVLNKDNSVFFDALTEMGHEQVLVCSDNDTGLKAIIGIHNSTLGPCLGGTRMWTYKNDAEALKDVLRLSRGMTFKASVAGLNLGGGKAVIIGDSRTQKSEALMRRFGKFVNNLGGKYITAEDVGTSTQDMEWINTETDHVTGIPKSMGGSGDPSPFTAYGTYLGMKASMKKHSGNESLEGKRIIVQGVGNVGYYLCEYLHKEGAKLFIHDIFEDKIKRIVDEFGATVISQEAVYSMEADVYSPNALGATVNPITLESMRVPIIAGAANNQLEDEIRDALSLEKKGLLYAPDFVINAGGLINVFSELEGYNEKRAFEKTEKIFDTIFNLYDYSSSKGMTTSEGAMHMAKERINSVGNIHKYL